MPQIENSIEGAKAALDRNDVQWADACLDGCDKALKKAREQTEEQIQKRNDGTYNPEDYDEGEEWGQHYRKGRKNGA